MRLDVRANGVITVNCLFQKSLEIIWLKKDFVENYYDWYLVKCSEDAPINELAPVEQQQNKVQNPYAQMVYDAAARNFPNTHHHFLPHCDDVVTNLPHSPLHIEEDPNPQSRQFFEMLINISKNCTYTRMSVIGRMMNLKMDFRIPERLYDEIYQLNIEVLPKNNWMTSSFYIRRNKFRLLDCRQRRLTVVLMSV